MTVNQANEYIKMNRTKVNDKYRHVYHAMAPIGWINDPNGFCEFKGEHHLFFQYYPYDSQWGPMYWGHVKSKDFIKWEELPVALAPDQSYDEGGAFSGSAIQVKDELYLMYTGHTNPEKENPTAIRQVQCLAKSNDGISFEKLESNPVITSLQIPKNGYIQDFRDPKIWEQDNHYYAVIGSKTKENKGQIGFYVSSNLINWEYLNNFTLEEPFGSVWECPDLFELQDHRVLLISPQNMKYEDGGSENIHSTIAMLGTFDTKSGSYEMQCYQTIDTGFDFYAPQTLKADDGRRVMIAWMNMWERTSPLHDLGHLWAGSMTLPREIYIKNSKLYQQPIREIQNYRKNDEVAYNLEISGQLLFEHIKLRSHELYIELDDMTDKVLDIDLFKNDSEALGLTIDGIHKEIILNRSNIGYAIKSLSKSHDFKRRQKIAAMEDGVKLQIFIDVSSVEIFINGGEHTMTSLVYPKEPGCICFTTKDTVKIKTFKKWDIEV